MGVIEVSMEQPRNARAGETRDPGENPPTNARFPHAKIRSCGGVLATLIIEGVSSHGKMERSSLPSAAPRVSRSATPSTRLPWRRSSAGIPAYTGGTLSLYHGGRPLTFTSSTLVTDSFSSSAHAPDHLNWTHNHPSVGHEIFNQSQGYFFSQPVKYLSKLTFDKSTGNVIVIECARMRLEEPRDHRYVIKELPPSGWLLVLQRVRNLVGNNERLECSSTTEANRVRFPAGLLPGFLGDIQFTTPLHSDAAPYSHHFTSAVFQDLEARERKMAAYSCRLAADMGIKDGGFKKQERTGVGERDWKE
ncbi:hypothetical protein PR048_000032 [Dryococelus australis]|uniref:Uncharacterized protein n=1 Tax=Dryococelus australis TaxID=614101 RepID=A0ABQ9IDH6_9NEOP|nr:hypothetical protein PR048_000032 [Dryococelus australis]